MNIADCSWIGGALTSKFTWIDVCLGWRLETLGTVLDGGLLQCGGGPMTENFAFFRLIQYSCCAQYEHCSSLMHAVFAKLLWTEVVNYPFN